MFTTSGCEHALGTGASTSRGGRHHNRGGRALRHRRHALVRIAVGTKPVVAVRSMRESIEIIVQRRQAICERGAHHRASEVLDPWQRGRQINLSNGILRKGRGNLDSGTGAVRRVTSIICGTGRCGSPEASTAQSASLARRGSTQRAWLSVCPCALPPPSPPACCVPSQAPDFSHKRHNIRKAEHPSSFMIHNIILQYVETRCDGTVGGWVEDL